MGFGASVLAHLIKSRIKRNLYYEIKDRVVEERFDGINTVKKTKRTKVYGFDETKESRNKLMEILRDRMEHHKGKFVSPIIYNELTTLEVKKNGRIEHSSNTHDDQVFSLLMALYVWYEGKNLMESFGIEKGTLYTDADQESDYGDLEESHRSIMEDIDLDDLDDENNVNRDLKELQSVNAILYKDWEESERVKNKKAMDDLLNTRLGRKAYSEKFHIDEDDIKTTGNVFYVIPDSVFLDVYNDNPKQDELLTTFRGMGDQR